MLQYAIALISALLGFGGIAASSASFVQVLFVIFIVLALASFLIGIYRRG